LRTISHFVLFYLFIICLDSYDHHLPEFMPNDKQKRYLLVAIDHATRWVHFKVIQDKKASTAATFLEEVAEKCPVIIKTVLTDNGKEFTDRFIANGKREPTGNHIFDKACTQLTIETKEIAIVAGS
jgi:hypothetical protein